MGPCYNQNMEKLFFSFLDLIYKKKCYFCHKSKYSLKMCPDCYNTLMYSDFRPNVIIDGINVYTCGVYDKTLQKLIRGLKYHRQKELAFFLAKFMYGYFSNLNLKETFQVIPVPQHKNRLRKRKYNHMELTAEEFCKLSGNIPNFGLIKRIKDTKPQYKLSRPERLQNLAGAFEADISKDLGLPILILDDICTTGATFEEMINTFKQNGLTDITCLASSSP